MKLYYIKNSNRTFTGNGSVTVPKDVISRVAMAYGGNVFSDDILVFTGKTRTENGRVVRDYSDVQKHIAITAESEEDIYVVFETYNYHPDFDYNDPGTYYNAMGNYNTSKEDYEAARPWAATAEFISRGKVHNNNWHEAKVFAAAYADAPTMTVYVHTTGEKGLVDLSEEVRKASKTAAYNEEDAKLRARDAKLVYDGIPMPELWHLSAEGITYRERVKLFDEMETPSLFFNMDVAKCPYCGKYYQPHQEEQIKTWEKDNGKKIHTPYETTVIGTCPECYHDLTREDIESGQKYLQDRIDWEITRAEVMAKATPRPEKNGAVVKRGQRRASKVDAGPTFKMKHVEGPVLAPRVYVDPATITPQVAYEYKPCTFKPTPKKAWKVPKLNTGSLFIDWNPGTVRIDRISVSELIAEVKKTFEEADQRIAEARKNTRRKQNKVEVIPPLKRDFI